MPTQQPDEKDDEESVEQLASAKQAEIWVAKPKLDSAVEEQREAQKAFQDAINASNEKKCVAVGPVHHTHTQSLQDCRILDACFHVC